MAIQFDIAAALALWRWRETVVAQEAQFNPDFQG